MKKLYKITIPGESYVWAEDEDDALREGEHSLRIPFGKMNEFSFESGFEPKIEEVKAEDKVNKEWLIGIPFGKAPDEFYELTMSNILKKMKRESNKGRAKK